MSKKSTGVRNKTQSKEIPEDRDSNYRRSGSINPRIDMGPITSSLSSISNPEKYPGELASTVDMGLPRIKKRKSPAVDLNIEENNEADAEKLASPSLNIEDLDEILEDEIEDYHNAIQSSLKNNSSDNDENRK